MKKKTIKRLVITGALVALLSYHSIDYKYTPSYKIVNEDNCFFATYSKGKVFIGNRSSLSKLKDIDPDDILVLDERNGENPNMKVYNSYTINDKNIRNDIIEILCKYEECYPSNWDRTAKSMTLEWTMHNISHLFYYENDRTKDVDFDNNDERYYDNVFIRKLLKL